MSEDLRWSLEFDSKTGALRAAADGLREVNRETSTARASIVRFDDGARRMNMRLDETSTRARTATSHMEGLGTAFKVAAAGVGTLLTALSAGALVLDRFGSKAIEAFGERQGALRAYSTLLGSATKAEYEYGKAQALALKSDLTAAQVEGAQKKLMTAGFRGASLDRALLATTDVASMASPKDRELATERISKGFSDIMSKGKLQGEELKQLSEAGIGRGLITEEIRKSMHLKDASATEKLISKGGVDADTGIAAIQRAILKQFGTSKLGEYTTGAAGSLSGLLSNRDELMRNQLVSIDPENLSNVTRYKESLTDLNSAMSLDTKSGQNLSLVFQDMTNVSLGLKTAVTEFSTSFLEGFGEGYTKAIGGLGDSKPQWEGIGLTAKALGKTLAEKVAPAVVKVVHGFEKMEGGLNRVGDALHGFLLPAQLLLEGHPVEAAKARAQWVRNLATNSDKKADAGYNYAGADNVERDKKAMAEYGQGLGVLRPLLEDTGTIKPGQEPAARAKRRRHLGGTGGGGVTRYVVEDGWRGTGSGGGRGGLSEEMMAQVGRVRTPEQRAADMGQAVTANGGVAIAPGAVVININGAGKDNRELADIVNHSIDDFFMRRIGRYTRSPRPSRL